MHQEEIDEESWKYSLTVDRHSAFENIFNIFRSL